jgi:hypothetical protein
MGVKSM